MEAISSQTLTWEPYPGQRASTTSYKALFKGTPKSRDNFELSIIRIGEGGSFSPRHRHNFEQVRLPLNGAFNQSPKQDIPKDHIGYIAEGTPYGPQDLAAGIEFLLLQCGGPSGSGYMSHDELMQGTSVLKVQGEFSEGVFRKSEKASQVDRVNQDAYEAVWEHVNGKRIEYVEPRYREPITIDPQAFPWQDSEGMPGVQQRHFGTFNELGTAASQVRVEANASYVCKADAGRKLVVVMEGLVSQSGQEFSAWSGFNLSPGESANIGGAGDMPAVLLVLQLPHFRN